ETARLAPVVLYLGPLLPLDGVDQLEFEPTDGVPDEVLVERVHIPHVPPEARPRTRPKYAVPPERDAPRLAAAGRSGMSCVRCGGDIPAGSRFCPRCGTALAPADGSGGPPPGPPGGPPPGPPTGPPPGPPPGPPTAPPP